MSSFEIVEANKSGYTPHMYRFISPTVAPPQDLDAPSEEQVFYMRDIKKVTGGRHMWFNDFRVDGMAVEKSQFGETRTVCSHLKRAEQERRPHPTCISNKCYALLYVEGKPWGNGHSGGFVPEGFRERGLYLICIEDCNDQRRPGRAKSCVIL
jgi:hypothetical protein